MNVTCRDMGTSDIMACNNIFGRILVLSRHKVETKYNVVMHCALQGYLLRITPINDWLFVSLSSTAYVSCIGRTRIVYTNREGIT